MRSPSWRCPAAATRLIKTWCSRPLRSTVRSSRLCARCRTRSPRAEPFSVDDGLVDKLAQLRTKGIRARRHELGHEHDGDLVDRVDPESRAREATPIELAGISRDLRCRRIENRREAETETHAVVPDLGEQRPAVGLQVGAAWQMVA